MSLPIRLLLATPRIRGGLVDLLMKEGADVQPGSGKH